MTKGNLTGLLKQAQKIQEKILKAQEELENIVVEGSAGGGMVTVRVNGKQELVGLVIAPEVVDPQDTEMLEDLVMAAVNQGLEKAQEAANEQISSATGGLLGGLAGGIKFPGLT